LPYFLCGGLPLIVVFYAPHGAGGLRSGSRDASTHDEDFNAYFLFLRSQFLYSVAAFCEDTLRSSTINTQPEGRSRPSTWNHWSVAAVYHAIELIWGK
jgi:hypothetical protein